MLFDSRQQSCWRDWKLTMIIFFFSSFLSLFFFSPGSSLCSDVRVSKIKKNSTSSSCQVRSFILCFFFALLEHILTHTHTCTRRPILSSLPSLPSLSNLSPISLQSLSNLSEYACSTYKERKVWMRRRRRKEQYYVLSHKSHHIRYTSIISGQLLFQQQSIQLDIVFSPQLPHFIITGMWTSTKHLDWWEQKEEQNFFSSPSHISLDPDHSLTNNYFFFFHSFSPLLPLS